MRHLFLAGILSLIGTTLYADSLWARKSPDQRQALWSSRRGLLVGDIVTVLIQEASEASEREEFTRSRTHEASSSLAYDLGPAGADGGDLTFGANRDISAEHAGETEKNFTTRLSATIKERLFNGNLIIEAQRQLTINDEITTVVISGIIRPDDIRGDNTVLSESIAEAQIRYEGKGNIGEVRKKGRFGSRIIDFVIPF